MAVAIVFEDSATRDVLTRALWDGLGAAVQGSTFDDLIFDAGGVRNAEAESRSRPQRGC